jgi:hypothetical protein
MSSKSEMEVFGYFNKKSSSREGLALTLTVGRAEERTIPTIERLTNEICVNR